MPGPVRRLAARVGLDRAIAFGVTGKVWQALSTVVTVALLVTTFTPSEQGYYYAVQNLVAWQVLVELGLGFVLMQVTSHERAAVDLGTDGRLHGAAARIGRVVSLLRQALRWYALAAVALGVVLVPLGWRLLGTQQATAPAGWALVWAGVVAASAASLLLVPLVSTLEGLGEVAEVAQLRLTQDVLGFAGLWAAFAAGAGLAALVVFHALRALAGAAWLLARRRPLFAQLLGRATPVAPLDWRGEVWPLQWRVALSSVSGLFLFYVVNPLAFVHYSATDAGRLGLSQNVMNGVQSVALVWCTSRSPQLGRLVAERAWGELDRVFRRALGAGTLVAVAGCAAVIAGAWALQAVAPTVGARVLPVGTLALLAVPVLVNQVTFAQSLYLRAHRRDPFLVPSVVGAVLTVCALLLASRHLAFGGFVLTYALLSLPGLGWSTWIWRRARLTLRAAAGAPPAAAAIPAQPA